MRISTCHFALCAMSLFTVPTSGYKHPHKFADPFRGGGMSTFEQGALAALLSSGESEFEWGTGSSTALAVYVGLPRIVSTDSSSAWIESCAKSVQGASVTFQHVDIGPVKEVGYPSDTTKRDQWPLYSRAVDSFSPHFASYLIDGRFRVACACRALLHGDDDSRVIIHDFPERPWYHSILQVADLVSMFETLAVIQRKKNVSRAQIEELWLAFRYDAK